jgi:hypothetical protein
MAEQQRAESALINNSADTSAKVHDPDGRGQARWPPALPPGFLAQPCWSFHDPTGRFAYTFNRVYGPTGPLDDREPTRSLDEGRSYWSVSWQSLGEVGYERSGGRSTSYDMTRGSPGRRPSFAEFSSLSQMEHDLPGLLHVDDIGLP